MGPTWKDIKSEKCWSEIRHQTFVLRAHRACGKRNATCALREGRTSLGSGKLQHAFPGQGERGATSWPRDRSGAGPKPLSSQLLDLWWSVQCPDFQFQTVVVTCQFKA